MITKINTIQDQTYGLNQNNIRQRVAKECKKLKEITGAAINCFNCYKQCFRESIQYEVQQIIMDYDKQCQIYVKDDDGMTHTNQIQPKKISQSSYQISPLRIFEKQIETLFEETNHSLRENLFFYKLNIYKQKLYSDKLFVQNMEKQAKRKFQKIKQKESLEESLYQLSRCNNPKYIAQFQKKLKQYKKNPYKSYDNQREYESNLKILISKQKNKEKAYDKQTIQIIEERIQQLEQQLQRQGYYYKLVNNINEPQRSLFYNDTSQYQQQRYQ